MAHHSEHDRIARKAHELWESEGRPHGRDQVHWDEAKEIIALEDSMEATLKPRDSGASEPEEPAIAVTNQGEMPNLTDQGADDLTSIDREPAVTKPTTKGRAAKAPAPAAKPPAGKTAAVEVDRAKAGGGQAHDALSDGAAKGGSAPDKPAAGKTQKPAAAAVAPVAAAAAPVTGKAVPKAATKPGSVTRGRTSPKT